MHTHICQSHTVTWNSICFAIYGVATLASWSLVCVSPFPPPTLFLFVFIALFYVYECLVHYVMLCVPLACCAGQNMVSDPLETECLHVSAGNRNGAIFPGPLSFTSIPVLTVEADGLLLSPSFGLGMTVNVIITCRRIFGSLLLWWGWLFLSVL